MGILSISKLTLEMRRVLEFLKDEGRDILGISLGGVGWGGAYYRDESKDIVVL